MQKFAVLINLMMAFDIYNHVLLFYDVDPLLFMLVFPKNLLTANNEVMQIPVKGLLDCLQVHKGFVL